MDMRDRLSGTIAAALLLCFSLLLPARAEPPLDAIVSVHTKIPGDARLAQSLGREREGSGVIIDDSGLVLTVGYIMLEAQEATVRLLDGRSFPAQIVGYDHDSGLGLLRTLVPPDVEPAELGSAADLKGGDSLTFVSGSGGGVFEQVSVVSRRTFAGYWEYLLETPLFTAPPLPGYAGAALFDDQDRLVGIGSLFAGDAGGGLLRREQPEPGNMSIPVDALMPVFADLLATGRRSTAITPWTGLVLDDSRGILLAIDISREGPAAAAGLRQGDAIFALNDIPTPTVEAYMIALRGAGQPGISVTIQYFRPGEGEKSATVTTIDRADWLRLNPSY